MTMREVGLSYVRLSRLYKDGGGLVRLRKVCCQVRFGELSGGLTVGDFVFVRGVSW